MNNNSRVHSHFIQMYAFVSVVNDFPHDNVQSISIPLSCEWAASVDGTWFFIHE